MWRLMRSALVVVVFFLYTACATTGATGYYYNEVVIINKSPVSISDVAIRVEKTNAVFICGFIPAGADCANKFPKKKYLGNEVTLSWNYKGAKQTRKFTLRLAENLDKNKPLAGVLEIAEKNDVKAYFQQD
jgi:hypothetical protein